MPEAAYTLALVCEGPADHRIGTLLADKVFAEKIDWLPDILESMRAWQGVEPVEDFLAWRDVRRRAAERRVAPIFGHFDGRPGEPDALLARHALLLFTSLENPPDAVVLLRDSDGYPDRAQGQGLRQARDSGKWPFGVAVGVEHPKRECWVLACFQAVSPAEAERLRVLTERLGFDPVRGAHGLTAREHGAQREAKRALEELIPEQIAEREAACFAGLPVEVLRQRGQYTGIADYIDECEVRLVPVLARGA